MKNVLKIFIAAAIAGVMTVSAFAQGAGPAGGAKGGQKGGPSVGPGGPGGPGRGQGGGMRRGGMGFDTEVLAKLKLTPDQDKKVKALKEATKKKGEALRAELMKNAPKPGANGGKPGGPGAAGGPGGQRFQMTPELREKFKAIQEGYIKGLKGILTPAQMTDYEKQMKEMRAKFQQRGGPGGPGGGAPGKGGPGAPPGKGGAAGKGKGKGGL